MQSSKPPHSPNQVQNYVAAINEAVAEQAILGLGKRAPLARQAHL